MTVVRGVRASALEPAGTVRILRRSIGLYYRNLGVLATFGLLFGALPACMLLAFGNNPYGDPDPEEILISIAVGSLTNCFLVVAVIIVCLLHFVDLEARIPYVISQLWGRLTLRMIGTMILETILSSLLLLAFIVPGVLYIIRWFLYPNVVVVEGAYYIDSLRRSCRIVRGHWWRAFGLFLIIFVVQSLSLAGYWVMTSLDIPEFYSALSGVVLGALLTPSMQIASLLFYFDLRVRQEGLTLEALQESIDLKGSLSGWKF